MTVAPPSGQISEKQLTLLLGADVSSDYQIRMSTCLFRRHPPIWEFNQIIHHNDFQYDQYQEMSTRQYNAQNDNPRTQNPSGRPAIQVDDLYLDRAMVVTDVS